MKKKRRMPTLKNSKDFLYILFLLVGLVYCSRYFFAPLSSKFVDAIQGHQLEIKTEKDFLTIAVGILKNSSFVLQFTGIVVAIISFLGVKEIISVRKVRENMSQRQKDLEEEHILFRNTLRQEHNLIQAKIFYTQKFYDEAWEALAKIPDDFCFEEILYRGLISTKRKDYHDAITYFGKALKFPGADVARVYFNLGNCWLDIERYDDAIKEYDNSIHNKRNYLSAYNNKAICLRRLGQIDNAIVELLKIIDIDKKYVSAYYNLACYQALMGDRTEALKNLRKTFQLSRSVRSRAENDPDLASLRALKEYVQLMDEFFK